MTGAYRFLTSIHQQEAAGTVGVFRHARLYTHLAEQRGLLVTSNTSDWDTGTAFTTNVGLAVHFRGWTYLWQHFTRDVQDLQHLAVPIQGVDVEQHGTGGVGVVGHVYAALGHLPYQPSIDGTEQQLATLGALTGTFHVIQNPFYFGAGEVRVNHQTGVVADVLFQTLGF